MLRHFTAHTLRRLVFVLLLAALLMGCSGTAAGLETPSATSPPQTTSPLPAPTNDPTQTAAPPTPALSPPAVGRCPAPYSTSNASRPLYTLYLYLGVAEHAGYVEEQILFPNTSGEALEEVVLVVEAARTPGVFSLTSLELGGEQTREVSLDAGLLRVPLAEPLPDGCTLDLRLVYHLEIPEQAGVFGYTDNQLALTNWFPFLPPYQSGQGWLVHEPGTYGEHWVYPIADFDVTVELADPPPGILVAAPAPAEASGAASRYTLRGARTFSLVVLNGYSLRQQQWNGIEVAVYTKRATILAAEAALQTALDSLAFFESTLGPYPFQSLTIVQLEMYDGMESDGIFFLSEEVFGTYNAGPRNMLVYLVAHETSHNWWFSQVGSDQALEPWLDEALATYSEVLFYEEAHPAHAAWWWEYRIDQWQPDGIVDASIYTYPLYEAYRQAVYLRGAAFLDDLRQRMGDEAFLAFLRSYLEQGRYQVVSADDFFALLEERSAVEITDLWGAYFDSP